jgi:hypothetical protein
MRSDGVPGIGMNGLMAAAALALAGCGGPEKEPAPPEPEPAPANTAAMLPIVEPPLDRERLMLAVARAASAFSAGIDDSQAQAELKGRQFSLPIRFGCSTPAEGSEEGAADAAMRWSYDAESEVLKVRAQPDITGATPAAKLLFPGEVEAIEGFWVPQPWMFQDACPAAAPAAASAAPAAPEKAGKAESGAAPAAPAAAASPVAPTVGLVQLFGPADSRLGRRAGRAYEATHKLAPEGVPRSGGLVLVLSGRLEALPDRRVIACTAAQGGGRPVCLVSVKFDRVSVAIPGARAPIAQWGAS